MGLDTVNSLTGGIQVRVGLRIEKVFGNYTSLQSIDLLYIYYLEN